MDLYPGAAVKTTKEEGKFEIIKVENITEEVICIPINSIDNQRRTFKFGDLEEAKRG